MVKKVGGRSCPICSWKLEGRAPLLIQPDHAELSSLYCKRHTVSSWRAVPIQCMLFLGLILTQNETKSEFSKVS